MSPYADWDSELDTGLVADAILTSIASLSCPLRTLARPLSHIRDAPMPGCDALLTSAWVEGTGLRPPSRDRDCSDWNEEFLVQLEEYRAANCCPCESSETPLAVIFTLTLPEAARLSCPPKDPSLPFRMAISIPKLTPPGCPSFAPCATVLNSTTH